MFVMSGGRSCWALSSSCVLLIVNFRRHHQGGGPDGRGGGALRLDGMPGKQLAIDSDMAAGAIGHEEAKGRREREQAETDILRARWTELSEIRVKGDAIGGPCLITLLNLVMGLVIGSVIHGMPLGRAFETYAI